MCKAFFPNSLFQFKVDTFEPDLNSKGGEGSYRVVTFKLLRIVLLNQLKLKNNSFKVN